MDELNAGGELAPRILGLRPGDQPPVPPAPLPQPSGFPSGAWTMRVDSPR